MFLSVRKKNAMIEPDEMVEVEDRLGNTEILA